MKKILFLLLISLNVSAQTFDNTISRYVADSVFSTHTDSIGHEYVTITPTLLFLGVSLDRIYYTSYTDSNGCTCGYAKFTLTGKRFYGGGGYELTSQAYQMEVNNDNCNIYNGVHYFLSSKFLYWCFADRYNLDIQ